jgi:tetratricopeptide (TPR) repeat protein
LLQFFGLRLTRTFLLLPAIVLAARADVIQLKNGKRIVADSAHETNGRIEYTIGDNTFAIPKALVEKIDTGPGSGVPADKPSASEIPSATAPVQFGQGLEARVIHDGQVDTAALKAIENEGPAERSAAANFVAAYHEEKRNNLAAAARYLQVALIYGPKEAVLLEHYVSVLLQLGKNIEALSYAERATAASPQSGDAFALLGYAYYQNGRIQDAISAWKKSLALRPNDQVKALLGRAERESHAEAEFRQQESGHFVLRYEGEQAPDSLRSEILDVLEAQYRKLQNDFGAAPANSISVSLYTNQAFFDVTQAPAWSAAMNDGKIRIPVSGMTRMSPALARVLRHELVHSFTAQITHGRVPQWLDEGLAQLEEPGSAAAVGSRLAALYSSGRQIPLNQLERSFHNFSADEAAVAYAEALAAAECIRAIDGMADLARILQRLGDGEPIESALRNTIHAGYAQLENEIADYLRRTYGQ